jgi:DNA-binding LacI/PurR family transcriptional regulator
LEWFDVFPEGLPKDPSRSIAGKLRRLLLDTGLTRYELDRFFTSARTLGAPLWVCADDLLALAALDHFDARNAPNDPRPGVLGFGNHPFSLARGLCTVDPSWNTLVERAIELFTGYGRRSRKAVHRVIDAPSESVYGGNILGRSQDWW